VKLALLNELLGQSSCAPILFGAQAPDSGNAEILAHYGTPALKERWLEPWLRNDMVSAFSMTEPQGGADPKVFTTTATWSGECWVISGEKWFMTNASHASCFIVLALTDPEAPDYRRQSMFLLPSDAAGIEIVRNSGVVPGDDTGVHAYVRYHDVRDPADALLGERGAGFEVAQTRLGGGSIHHAMRAVATARRCLDLMSERALSRTTQGEVLARKQLVQEMIADSWIELESFRLLVLRTAWRIDRLQDYRRVRGDIAAVKAACPESCGTSRLERSSSTVRRQSPMRCPSPTTSCALSSSVLADGPTEVHKITVARDVLQEYEPTSDMFPESPPPATQGICGGQVRRGSRERRGLVTSASTAVKPWLETVSR
jgi:acyl-CoA dehydrogenase